MHLSVSVPSTFLLSYHSRENINYLHDFLNSSWIMIEPNSEQAYASLSVLDEAYFLAPGLVKGFVAPHFDMIVNLCFVSDFELQDAALQVIYHHVGLSGDADCRTSLFVICYSHLTPKPSSANRGALYIAKMLAKMHLTENQIISIILMITTFLNLQDEMVLQLCFEVVYMIFEQCEIKITPVLMNNLCNSMMNCIKRKVDNVHIFTLFVKIMKMTPVDLFQTDIILTFIEYVFSTSKLEKRLAYSLLLIIIQRNPQINISFSIPFDSTLSKDYRSILKIKPRLILESQKKLQNFVDNSLKQTTNEPNLILALKIAKVCCSMLWDGAQTLIRNIYPLYSSNSENVRNEVIKIIGNFPNQHELMVSASLFDLSPKVRRTAIKSLFKQENLSRYDLLPNILNDQSVEVTFEFLDFLDNIYDRNPMLFTPSIFAFYKKLTGGYLRSFSLKDASVASHLFPKFATLILKVDDSLAKSFADFTIYVLRRGESPIPPLLNDILVNNSILKPFGDSSDQTIKNTIFRLVHLPLVNTCDINFLNTLQILKEKADYSQVVPLFKEFFRERRKQNVLQVALTTLQMFIPFIELPLDQQLVELLFDVLNETSFPNVTTAVLKLFGTAGITHLPSSLPKASKIYQYTSVTDGSTKFIRDELFKSLCHLVPTQLPSFFSAATHAMVLYPDQASSYLGTLIPEFIKILSIEDNDSIVIKLTHIVMIIQNFMTPYVEIIQPLLLERLENKYIIRLCRALSYSLKNNFIPYSSKLYHRSISIVPNLESLPLFKQHLKFLSSSIILQHQPINTLLKLCESIISEQKSKRSCKTTIVIHELIKIIQNYDSTRLSTSWFIRIFTKCYKNPNALQLIYSIITFGNISHSLITQILESFASFDENYLKLMNNPQLAKDNLIMIPIHMKIISIHRSDFYDGSIFDTIVPPINNNIDKWVQDFTLSVVSGSPSRGIRACRDLVNQSEQFRNDILPAAFLTCWKETSENQKNQFLNVFKFIIDTFHPIPESLWRMIDILDTCRVSFEVPLSDLARSSIFPAQALHYWKCDFRRSKENVEFFLNQLLNLGQIDTARGVLMCTKNYIKDVELWAEELGEWREALKIYGSNNIVGTIQCFGNLEDWRSILKLESKFAEMSTEEKNQCAVWFGWAFYFYGDIKKAESFIKFFPEKFEQNQFFLQCFIKIIHNEFDYAENMIKKAFDIISNDHSMFDGSNVKVAEEKMVFSQHLVELSEVIKVKKENSQNIPKLWNFRQPLQERHIDCRELTNIRCLLFSKEEKLKISIKMAASLRKGRQWSGLGGAYSRMLRIGNTPKVYFEGIKMLWCVQKRSAIDFLSIWIDALKGKSADALFEKFSLIPEKRLRLIVNNDVDFENFEDYNLKDLANKTFEFFSDNKVSEKFLARATRILTAWRLQEEPQTLESLISHCNTLRECNEKQNEDDVKTLFSLALVQVQIIDNDVENIDFYANESVRNFLKIIQMSNDMNFSVMLLLLHILSRCANDNLMSYEVEYSLKNLPVSLITKSLPQLVNLLSHSCEKLRNTIRHILINFGTKRFQKVFFPINIGRFSDSQMKSKNSCEIFEQLRNIFPDVASDLLLFVKNMQCAAISLLEAWKYGIESAKQAHEQHDEDSVVKILSQILERFDSPICDLDRNFKRFIEINLGDFRELLENYKITRKSNKESQQDEKNQQDKEKENDYINCMDRTNKTSQKTSLKNLNMINLAKNNQKSAFNKLWTCVFSIYEQISRKVNQLAIISFPTVAPDLAIRRDLKVLVPGTHDTARIVSFDPTMRVFGTAFHPRFMTMIDEKGKSHHFLLKGNCDVRIDYRIMQFFILLNSLLYSNRVTTNLSVTQYSIVPLTKDSGLISWVENSDSLHQIIGKFTENRNKETSLIKSFVDTSTMTMSALQLYELYQIIAEQTPADELDQYIWLQASTSSVWLKNNTNFVTSTALMSIAGYIIGLGDRHPNNILLQSNNGKVAHIDFEDCFEITMNRKIYPEKVPFRLTRMISNALDGATPFGTFRRTCEDVLSLLREAKQTVIAQFYLFTIDSTISKNSKFYNAKIVERVKEKLEGNDIFMLKHETKTVESQVKRLINVSSNPEMYATQFIGWCPYW
ncbi:hypothetical protein TRFO_18322 [Tritrichomonas foetus]|uniref:non-specific serine/threonine protein kinase n=1 Tax=Tritrichomonas foetus TaxID=1144522 RepID=A0A1J4KLD8_9EUKA|nr:hypothetical protein TRFO_18322 [Tritrichomonas foetus]|eukprot:OHT11954.1 hypothetical protein TRFO_18322 [Tritrichomonas foetus]